MDGDASGRPELEHAPTTTDPIESCYGELDQVLIIGAGMRATFGVAVALLFHAFESAAAKRARAKEAVARRKERGIGDGSEEEEDKLVAAWNVTIYSNLSPEERCAIIKDIRRRYKGLCVLAPKGVLEEHAKAKLELLKAART